MESEASLSFVCLNQQSTDCRRWEYWWHSASRY